MSITDELVDETKEEEDDEEDDDEEKEEEKPEKSKSAAISSATAKLKGEIADNATNRYAIFIGSQLLLDFQKDEELSQAYLDNKQTLKSIYDTIYERAKKLRYENCAVIEDEVVYGWARDICHLKPKEKEKKEESKPATKEAKAIIKQAVGNAQLAQEKPKQKKEKKEDTDTLSLFDFIGVN
jgi:hypothetical protein